MLDLLIVGGLFPWILNVLMGLYVFFRNPRHIVYQKFLLFNLSIAFWSVGSFFVQFTSHSIALTITKICYLAACFLPAFSVDFGISLADHRKSLPRITYLLPLAFSIFLLFGDSFVQDLRQLPNQRYYVVVPGVGYYGFFIYFLIFSTVTLTVLYKAARRSIGLRKKQLIYAFFAYIIAAFAGLD